MKAAQDRSYYYHLEEDVASDLYKKFFVKEDLAYMIQTTYYSRSYDEICRGYISGNNKNRLSSDNIFEVINQGMENLKVIALSECKCSADVNVYNSNDVTYIFTKCDGGIIGCGCLCKDNIDDRRIRVCGALLYVFGVLNESNDPVLADATINHLIYHKKLGGSNQYKNLLVRM